MKKYLVYRHITPDGKSYVGCTSKSLEERWGLGYKHCVRFKAAVEQFGWEGMQHEILADDLDETEAYRTEREMIAKYQSDNPQFGYNISKGGKSTFEGLKHSEESRNKIRESNIGKVFSEEHRKNLSYALKGLMVGAKNPMYGKRKSNSTIQKQYQAHRHEMKPIVQKDLNGNVLNVFFSFHEAMRRTGVNRSCIKKCAEGQQKSSKGYIWEYGRSETECSI